MAKAKEPTNQDCLLIFKDILNRSKLDLMIYQNQTILSIHKDGHSVLTVAEPELWAIAMEDEEFRTKVIPFDMEKHGDLRFKFRYAERAFNDDWISIDPDKMYSGDLVQLKIDGLEYDIPINVKVFPLKLRKTEFNGFAYRVTKTDRVILCIRKRFDNLLPGKGFCMITPFQVI